MGLALALRELSKRRVPLLLGVLVAAVAAVFSVYRVDGSQLKPRSLQYSSASTQVLVDSPSSVLGNLRESFEPLSARAVVYANFMASPAVLELIGKHVGLSGEQIYAAGPVDASETRVEQEPTALKRNVEITGETDPYRLNFGSQANLPTISIDSQAPTTSQAVALANAAVLGLQEYVAKLQQSTHTPAAARVQIRQLGTANGAVVDGGVKKDLLGIVFIIVLLAWCGLILVGARFRDAWRATGPGDVTQAANDKPQDEAPHDQAPGAGHGPTMEHRWTDADDLDGDVLDRPARVGS
jgi:hypothetical protein